MSSKLVTLKSYKDGIRLILDAEAPMDQIMHEITDTFRSAKQFLGSETVVLSVEGREVSENEEMQIVETIQLCCDLKILCLIGHDEAGQRSFLKAKQQIEKRLGAEDTCRFFKGSLTDGQSLEVEESIVILGDVNPGCSVSSHGSIIVMGGLYGEAHAGGATDENNFVAALELSAELLFIGGVIYEPSEKPKWGIRPKVQPKIAYPKNGTIQIENLSRQALEKLYAF